MPIERSHCARGAQSCRSRAGRRGRFRLVPPSNDGGAIRRASEPFQIRVEAIIHALAIVKIID